MSIPSLNKSSADRANLQAMFDAIAAGAAALDVENFANLAVDYRSVSVPPRLQASREFGYPSAISLTALTAPWYLIDQSVIDYDSNNTSAYNKDTTGMPVATLSTWYSCLSNGGSSPTQICVCYYNAGAWVIASKTYQVLGHGSGRGVMLYTSTSIGTDYMFNIATTYRKNMPFEKPNIITVALGGSSFWSIPLAGTTKFGICINSNAPNLNASNVGMIRGYISIEARDDI